MTTDNVITVCERLASTQQNLPVPMTQQERDALREAAKLLHHNEQEVEAAFISGYEEGQSDGYVVCNPDEALDRFRASRAAQQKEP